MPWTETSSMDQRERFIHDERPAVYSMTELSARYRISRRTAHKWLARFDEEGRAGLRDRSRAPHPCPHRVEWEVAQVIVAARRAHPSWSPKTLLDWLGPGPKFALPAASAAGDLLARRGLVKKRRRPHTLLGWSRP
jgi:putative transposase